MKNKYFSILIFILYFFSSCREVTSNKAATPNDNIVAKANNSITQSRLKQITFDDSVKMNIEGNIHVEKNIDSILIEKKTLNAVYQYCGKSPLNKKLFQILKKTNKEDFDNINNIATAHSIITKTKDTFYISGFEKNKCMEKNERKKIAVKIYSIYADKTQAKIMIIEDFL